MKKKLLALTLCLVLLMAPFATIGTYAAEATGYTLDEATKTYTVTTADGLLAVVAEINGGKLNYNVKLAANIDMKDKTWTPIGTDSGDEAVQVTDKAYSGTFDGDNYTISNLKYEESTGEAGIIGLADSGCVVKNLKLVDINIKGFRNVAAVIAITRKNATGLVKVENVHIRNAKIEGTRDKYCYAGTIIGQAGAAFTEIKDSTVVATLTSAGRASALIGGESVGSNTDATKLGVTISNVIVMGSYTTSSSNAQGVGGFLGYHSTIPLTLTNCVAIIDMFNTGHKDSTLGSLSTIYNKLGITATHCIGTDALFGKVSDTTANSAVLNDVSVYKLDETATEIDLLGVDFAAGDNVKEDAIVTVNGIDKTWTSAKVPVISKKADLSAKVAAIFTGNTVITSEVIDELIGHEHAFTKEVAETAYLKAAATCTEAATYYKSCSCGNFDANTSFTHGQALGHTPSENWSDDDDNHWHVCKTCLEAKSDEAAHTYGDWEVTKEATEKKEGERAKTCTVCSHEITEKTPKKEPVTTEAPDDAETTVAGGDGGSATEPESGCGGSVLGMGTMMMVALGAGALFCKKKHD